MIPLMIMVEGDLRDDPAGSVPRAAAIGDQWAPDAGSLEVWRYSANFLYTLTIDGVPHFLRVAPSSERTRDRLERELVLLDWLKSQGWQVPVAVHAVDGSRVATNTAGKQTYHAVMWTVVPGSMRDLDELSLEDVASWGAALGQVHAALRKMPANSGPRRVAWHAERDLIATALPVWPPAVQEIGTRTLDWIETRSTDGDEYGLIHGDFELDNLLWTADGLGVIDFDEAGWSWYVADIAFAVRELVAAGETLTTPRLAAFLGGYATAKPWATGLASELPRFSLWASLVTLARITHARADSARGLPGWAANLDQRLADLGATYQSSILAAGPLISE